MITVCGEAGCTSDEHPEGIKGFGEVVFKQDMGERGAAFWDSPQILLLFCTKTD